MQGLIAYVKCRVTAMRGDIERAIALCLQARTYVPAGNLALQLDTRITLGYVYFLNGDYAEASTILDETIRLGRASGAVINTVAASCLMARLYAVRGLLKRSYGAYASAAQCLEGASGPHLGVQALVEIGIADLLCEQNDLDEALGHLEHGLVILPFWDKADDWILAYVTLARIRLAQAKRGEAAEAVEKGLRLIETRGVFSEARRAVEVAQVKMWLAGGDLHAAERWAVAQEERCRSGDRFGFENELAHMARARVLIAQNRPNEAISLLSHVKEAARFAGRLGRVIEILLLEALAMREAGDSDRALLALTDCLTLAEPEGFVRIFLDEGQVMQMLLAQWLAQSGAGPLRDYAIRLLVHFDAESPLVPAAQGKTAAAANLVEPLSPRELEVLQLMALGKTNREVAGQLIVAPGTVKAHTSSIFRKLDAGNRTEAVARARKLGILH
jgi:LuxR family maltose regulon positive regulatory protein